jgi:hypothetical protein
VDEECCFDCPPGTDCDVRDNTIQSMKIAPGHWRVSNISLDIRPCVNNPEACEGGDVAGELGIHYCKLHHRGPYCSLCVEDYYPEGDVCKSCDDVSPAGGLYALLVLAVLIVALFVLYKKSNRFRKFVGKLNSRSMIVKAKLIITFFQVVLLLPVVFLVSYPTSYIQFLSVFEALNINVVEIFQLGCVPSWDFHASVIFVCMLPLCIGMLFAAGAMSVSHCVPNRKRRTKLYGHIVYWFLMLLYCVYPSLTYFVFQVFQCETFDNGSKLLRADYSIDCDADVHSNYVVFAGCMIVLYPLGVPLLYLATLWQHKKEVSDAQLRESTYAKSKHLAFFYADYRAEFWWWEIVVLVKKLLLTGFMVVCAQGTLVQVLISLSSNLLLLLGISFTLSLT